MEVQGLGIMKRYANVNQTDDSLPFRNKLKVNSTTNSKTPPPGPRRSTFGTKPLYNARAPSSWKIVIRLEKKNHPSAFYYRWRKESVDGRRVCPVIFGSDTRNFAGPLYARFHDLDTKDH